MVASQDHGEALHKTAKRSDGEAGEHHSLARR